MTPSLLRSLAQLSPELALSRRKLIEKIFAHVTARKIQNAVEATGDRMTMTPQQFGMQVGKQMGKQAFITLPATALGAGLGAATSPEHHRAEGAYRGAVKGTGTAVGSLMGMPLGLLAAAMLMKGKNLRPAPGRVTARRPMRMDMNARNIRNLQRVIGTVALGVPAGGIAGGTAGYAATSAALGKPSWESAAKTAANVFGPDNEAPAAAATPSAYARVFGKSKAQEIANRKQGLNAAAQQVRAANPGAPVATGTIQQGRVTPPPAAGAVRPPVTPAAPYPKKSVTADDAGEYIDSGENLKRKAAADQPTGDPGARTKSLINTLRSQGVSSGQWNNAGAGGFVTKDVAYSNAAKAKAKAPVKTPPAPAPTPAGGNVIQQKSRSAF